MQKGNRLSFVCVWWAAVWRQFGTFWRAAVWRQFGTSGGLHCGENFEVDFREGCMRSVKWNLNCGYQLSICLNEDDLSNLVRTAQRTQSDDRWMVCSETVGTAGGS